MLKKLWIKYQDNLKDQRDRLRKLAEAVGSDDKHTLTLKQQYELERHALTQRDLMQVQSELRRAQTELEVLEAKKGADDPPVPVSEEAIQARIESDETTKKLREQSAQLRDRITRASRVIRNVASDPAIRALRLEVEAVEKALNEHWKQMWPVVVKQLQEEARSGQKLGAGPLQEQIVLLTKLEEKLKLELSSLKEESRALNKGTLDLGELQEKIAHADTAARTIGTEIEALNVELQAPPRICVFEKAERPCHKDENKKLRVAGMASAGAFAVVLFGISFWEYRARRVGSVDEVVHALGMRIVGALPSLPRRAREGLSGADSPRNRHWHGLLIESVNATRTMLLHTAHLDSLRVIMVTSPNVGEAKTSVSVHLATSLARSGRRTLLVDCDLRRPTAHRLCGVPLEPGLSGALRDEVEIAATVVPTPVDGLWMIPAGRCDSRAVMALAQKDIRALFDVLKEQFDFVVVDSSPLLPVADSLLIAQHADGVILSILRGVSRLPEIHVACERLASLGVRTLGAIVSGASGQSCNSACRYIYSNNYDK